MCSADSKVGVSLMIARRALAACGDRATATTYQANGQLAAAKSSLMLCLKSLVLLRIEVITFHSTSILLVTIHVKQCYSIIN